MERLSFLALAISIKARPIAITAKAARIHANIAKTTE